MAQNEEKLLSIPNREKEKAVKELIEKSKLDSPYILLLIFSSVITTGGVLVNNIPVVIGGMLVTPLLTPFLTIALGISIGDTKFLNRSLWNSLKSILIVVLISMFLAFIFKGDVGEENIIIGYCQSQSSIYFLIALFSGIAGAFAYIHPKIAEALPGVAVSISLMPPLAILGIGIGVWSGGLLSAGIRTFLFNATGIVLGSLLVFSLGNFYKVKRTAVEEIKKE